MQKICSGLLPICVARKKNFVLQLSEKCIVRLYCKERKARGQFVLQYNILYCDLGARQGWTVLQYCARPSHDTATIATTRRWAGALGRAGGRAGRAVGPQVGVRGAQ